MARKPIQIPQYWLRMFAVKNLDMKLALLANEDQQQEWLSKPASSKVELRWTNEFPELIETKADAYFHVGFNNLPLELEALENLNRPVFLNSVIYPLSSNPGSTTHGQLFRLNAWPTFLQREITEIAVGKQGDEKKLHKVFSTMGWKYQLVPDIIGLITARVIAMIINEAYFTIEAGVSTKEEIDIAMKLGTNYPYGPFEWSEKIGLKNIFHLLNELSKSDPRYEPANLLIQETQLPKAWP